MKRKKTITLEQLDKVSRRYIKDGFLLKRPDIFEKNPWGPGNRMIAEYCIIGLCIQCVRRFECLGLREKPTFACAGISKHPATAAIANRFVKLLGGSAIDGYRKADDIFGKQILTYTWEAIKKDDGSAMVIKLMANDEKDIFL